MKIDYPYNLNDCIKVKLTDKGIKIHTEYYKSILMTIPTFQLKDCEPHCDKEDYTTYQLWEFMNIFGEHMYNGADPISENNQIYVILEE